jgi:hypothetical protein
MNIQSTVASRQKPLRKAPAAEKEASPAPLDTVDFNPARRGLFRRLDGADALAKTQALGKGLVNGRVGTEELMSVNSPDDVLEAAASVTPQHAKPLYEAVSRWATQGDALLPFGTFESLLTSKYGLKETGHGEVAANYEHHFDMNYAPDGGFRGSKSYKTEGRTNLGRISVLQKPGTPTDGPAVVVANYSRPGFVGPSLKGTGHDGSSSFNSLYFVPDASQVKGATGDTIGDDSATKSRMEEFLKSVESESTVELHSFSKGYGRVGTSYHSRLNAGDTVIMAREAGEHFPHAVAGACDHAIAETLGIQAAPVQEAPQSPSIPLNERLGAGLQGAIAGALIGGIGVAQHAILGPMPLVAMGVVGGVLTMASASAAKDPHDGYHGNRPGSYEAFKKRESSRTRKGVAAGLGLTAAIAAGHYFGLHGVLGTAAVGAVAGAALLVSSER